MILRPYQSAAIDACRAHVVGGGRRPLVVAPTGAGKGEMLCAMAQKPGVLVATTRTVLVNDLRHRLRRHGSSARVVTHQAIALAKKIPDGIKLLHVDEAHHASSPEFLAALEARPDLVVVGWSATPMREDGRGLSPPFDKLIETVSVRELVRQGFLVPCTVIAPKRLLKSKEIAQDPVDAWHQHARGRRTIAFCSRVDEAVKLAQSFSTAGVPATSIDGKMSAEMRELRLAAWRDGRYTVLTNVGIATEGFDEPSVTCVLLKRGANAALYLQIVGRGMRIHPGKSDMVLIDLRGVTNVHGAPDEPRIFSLVGKGIRRSEGDETRFCAICGAVLTEPGPCAECGVGAEPWVEPKVVNEPLVRYAGMRAKSPEQKREWWEWLKAEGMRKGHKPGAAYFKYRAVMNEEPPR